MKHLTTIIGIAAALCLASCGKDDENTPANSNNGNNNATPYNISFTVNADTATVMVPKGLFLTYLLIRIR